jgi:hypothetical protein
LWFIMSNAFDRSINMPKASCLLSRVFCISPIKVCIAVNVEA